MEIFMNEENKPSKEEVFFIKNPPGKKNSTPETTKNITRINKKNGVKIKVLKSNKNKQQNCLNFLYIL